MIKIISLLFNEFTNDIRVFKENKSFIKAGFKATIIAIHKKNLQYKENLEGIEIQRLKVDYINILPFNLLFFWIKSIIKYRNENIFHCNDLYTLPIAVFIKIFFNSKIKIVYDCHEFETDATVYIGKPHLKFIAKIIENFCIKYVNAVICTNKSVALEYKKMYKIKEPYLIFNCQNKLNTKINNNNLFRKEYNISKNKNIFLFQGYLNIQKGLKIYLETFKKRKNDILILMGGTDDNKDVINLVNNYTKKYKNIIYKKPVSLDKLLQYIISSDFGLNLVQDSSLNNKYLLPNKLFDYFIVYKPVISSDLPEMTKITKDYNVGVIAKHYSVKSLNIAINKIKKMKFENKNFDKINQIYNWENQEKVLIDIYKNL